MREEEEEDDDDDEVAVRVGGAMKVTGHMYRQSYFKYLYRAKALVTSFFNYLLN